MNILSLVMSISFLLLITFGAHAAEDELPRLQIYTEDWPPYQYQEQGELKGISVDLLVNMLEQLGSKQGRDDIKLVPWARAYKLLESTPNTMLFLTTRTEERNPKFKWVGPVFQNRTHLFALKQKSIILKGKDDLSHYRIGTVIDDVGEAYLLNLGVDIDRLTRATNAENNLVMMSLGRLDLVIDNWVHLQSKLARLGQDINAYESVMVVAAADVSYAFNINTPDSVITRFQDAFDLSVAQGELDFLSSKYGVTPER